MEKSPYFSFFLLKKRLGDPFYTTLVGVSGRVMNTSPRMATPPKKPNESGKMANALAARGITMTSNQKQAQQNRSPGRSSLPANINLPAGVSITPSSANRRPVVNHNVERPGPCATVDLTLDDEPNVSALSFI